MTEMEKQMAELEASAGDAMKALAEVVPPNRRAALSALDRFKGTSTQIVALSRRDTNVRSLEL